MVKSTSHTFIGLFLGALITSSSSCNPCSPEKAMTALEKENNLTSQPWKEVRDGLYIHENGDLGLASNPDIVFVPREELEGEACPNVFLINESNGEETTPLKELIDTATFHYLGECYYCDKHRIYSHFDMCDGGYIHIFSEDTSGFKLLGAGYVSQGDKIYYYRGGLLDADPSTFQTFEEIGQLAKDKNGYFQFYERVTEEALKNEMGEALFQKLKSLEIKSK